MNWGKDKENEVTFTKDAQGSGYIKVDFSWILIPALSLIVVLGDNFSNATKKKWLIPQET